VQNGRRTSVYGESGAIERALERMGGNRRKAAAALKISTVTLWRKMKQYGLLS
jgi:two-component system, NtrC family, response regulator AtoC